MIANPVHVRVGFKSAAMSQPEVENCAADLKGNQELRTALNSAGSDVPAVVKFANDKGLSHHGRRRPESHESLQTGNDLSDDEPDGFAGG